MYKILMNVFLLVSLVACASSESVSERNLDIKSKYITVLGEKIHYLEGGEGDPILFVHGNPTSSYLWRNILPNVAKNGRVIAIDLIGMGKSSKPTIDYTYLDHSRFFNAFIKKLRLKNVTMVLHDWGSFLGFDYAMKNPSNIKGLAFMEAMLMPVPSYQAMPPQVAQMMKAFRTPKVGWDMIVNKNMFIEKILPSMIVRKLSEEEMNNYRRPYTKKSSRKPLWRWPNELVIGGKPKENLEKQMNYLAKLKKSAIPKLLIHAAPGALIPPEMVKWCKSNLPKLESVELSGEGRHFIQEDFPNEISEAINSWIVKL